MPSQKTNYIGFQIRILLYIVLILHSEFYKQVIHSGPFGRLIVWDIAITRWIFYFLIKDKLHWISDWNIILHNFDIIILYLAICCLLVRG